MVGTKIDNGFDPRRKHGFPGSIPVDTRRGAITSVDARLALTNVNNGSFLDLVRYRCEWAFTPGRPLRKLTPLGVIRIQDGRDAVARTTICDQLPRSTDWAPRVLWQPRRQLCRRSINSREKMVSKIATDESEKNCDCYHDIRLRDKLQRL